MPEAVSLHPGGMPPLIVEAFRIAAERADAFRGATAPNPPVGCVLLNREGHPLAVAAHARAGEKHAEAVALDLCRRAGTLGEIDTVVVTLEPCNHFGRTPPCAEAILGTPARTVWIGAADPNPQVLGGGTARLREAGLTVHVLDDTDLDATAARIGAACQDLIGPFSKRSLTGRPWVTVKQALDPMGSMIPPPGVKTFTSAEALTLAHRLRKRADAVLTGSGTVLADDPSFTVRRIADHPGRRRHLVILDRRGRVPQSYLTAAETRGFAVSVEQDLEEALDRLGRDGALEVLVEAGPGVTASLLDADLWDEHVVIRKGEDDRSDTAIVRRRDGSSRAMPLTSLNDVI